MTILLKLLLFIGDHLHQPECCGRRRREFVISFCMFIKANCVRFTIGNLWFHVLAGYGRHLASPILLRGYEITSGGGLPVPRLDLPAYMPLPPTFPAHSEKTTLSDRQQDSPLSTCTDH